MRTESRELLAVGIFGIKSQIGDRIEMLLRRGRTFSPRASAAGVVTGAVALGALILAASFAPRWIAFAQPSPRPSFEVASIKPNNGSSRLVHVQPSPGGRFNAENVALRFLMQYAWDVKDFQIVGGPAWIYSDRYDLSAKAEGNPTGQQMMGPMLQTLLEDRFKLALHRETQQLPVYALTVAKSGLKLQQAKDGCTPWSPFSLNAPSSPLQVPGVNGSKPCGFLGFGVQGLDLTLDMSGATMAELTASLSLTRELHRTVRDNTGIAGAFDVHLKWTSDLSTASADSREPAPSSDAGGPSLFSALQEQLGLKLESAKGPVEVLVIDHVEKPDAN